MKVELLLIHQNLDDIQDLIRFEKSIFSLDKRLHIIELYTHLMDQNKLTLNE